MKSNSTQAPKLGVITLALMNVAAIASLRNLPIMAECGLSMLFFYTVATVAFFLPSALVSAELATAWPKAGGVYVWVKEAFGEEFGFLSVWLQVAKGFVWFPAVLAFVAGTLSYIINPEWAESRYYTLGVILSLFWLSIYITSRGYQVSEAITSFGSLFGTIIPGLFIIGLGGYWLFSGNPVQVSWSDAIIPDLTATHELTFLASTLIAFCGMELAAVHAQDVENPQRDFPKAILLASVLILLVSFLGSMSIAMIVPQESITLDAGIIQAFASIFQSIHMAWLTPIMAIVLVFGAIGAIQMWLLSPAKALLITAENGNLPPLFQKLNAHGIPVPILVGKGVIITVFSFFFLLMPSVNSSFWVLTAIMASIYLTMYMLLFSAAIVLRFKRPEVHRPFRVPGGNFGMILLSSLGFMASLFGFIIAFFPPTSKLSMGNLVRLEILQVCAILFVILTPFVIMRFRRRHWRPISKENPQSTHEISELTKNLENVL